jgi:hypothetical protein
LSSVSGVAKGSEPTGSASEPAARQAWWQASREDAASQREQLQNSRSSLYSGFWLADSIGLPAVFAAGLPIGSLADAVGSLLLI